MIEDALYSHLSGHAGLTALVSARIYPMVLPQNPSYPAVTYKKISGPRETSKAGPSGTVRARMQIDCWAESYAAAKQVAKQVRLAMATFSGLIADVTINKTTQQNDLDVYEPEDSVYHDSLDFIVRHKE